MPRSVAIYPEVGSNEI